MNEPRRSPALQAQVAHATTVPEHTTQWTGPPLDPGRFTAGEQVGRAERECGFETGLGVIVFHADHPNLPMIATIAFFPDPITWPEAAPDENPILRTSFEQANAIAAAILDTLANTPISSGACG